MGDSLTLRAATAADASLMARLHQSAFAEGWSAKAFAELMVLPEDFTFVVEMGGVPAGFVLARVAAGEAEILTLAISSDYRRRGLGRALMRAAAARAAEGGASALFLEVDAENIPARRLYEALGFAEVGRRGAYYRRKAGRAADALILKLQL